MNPGVLSHSIKDDIILTQNLTRIENDIFNSILWLYKSMKMEENAEKGQQDQIALSLRAKVN